MAQLTDDCFAFSGPLLPLEKVEQLINERIMPIEQTERVPLSSARGRVVARDIHAPVNLPHFTNSAVDGYAVRHADLNVDDVTTLRVAGRLMAGANATSTLRGMEAMRIFTGAPMPEGADTVFMQEDVQADERTVTVPSGLKPGANRRLAGEDIRAGDVAIPAGCVLDVAELALAAALGLAELLVRRRIHVAIFSTGDEITEPGETRKDYGVFDANRALLRVLLDHLGCQVTDLGILRDDPATLASSIKQAAKTNDLVLTSGGVSTGEADHVRAGVESIGKLVFWRVAIKPGRPVAMGVIRGDSGGTAFVGLPGNPVAVFVTFVRVVQPLIARLSGALPRKVLLMPVISAFAYTKKAGRREYVRVSLRRRDNGEYEAVKHPQDGAGVITSLTKTDGLVELPDEVTQIDVGTRVAFLSYTSLIG